MKGPTLVLSYDRDTWEMHAKINGVPYTYLGCSPHWADRVFRMARINRGRACALLRKLHKKEV